MLLIAALVVIAAVVVFVADVGGSGSPPKGPLPASAATATSTTAGSTSAGSTTASDVLGEVKLSPESKSSNAAGEVALVKNGSSVELAFSASHLPSPGSGRYVLLLFKGGSTSSSSSSSSSSDKALGVVSASSINSSGSVGPLAVQLPSDAADYNGIALVLQGGSAGNQIVLYGGSSSGF